MSDLFFQEHEQSDAALLIKSEQKHFQQVVEEHKKELKEWMDEERDFQKRKCQIGIFEGSVWQLLPWYTKLWRTIQLCLQGIFGK